MAKSSSYTDNKSSKGCNAAEEFTAALEASSGRTQPEYFKDPMDRAVVLEAFNRLLVSKRPDRGLEILARTGLVDQYLPEVGALVGFGDSIKHKDVWEHTKKVVRQSPPRLVCRWAALLHDIGKVPTRRFQPDGQVTFIGHPEVGARMFKSIARRFPFPDDARQSIKFLIAAHLRGSAYNGNWTDSAVRRFAKDAGHNLQDLLDLARADITSKYEEKVLRGLRQINELAARIKKVVEEDSKPAPLPKGLGQELIRKFQITPGPGLGRLMDALADEVENNGLEAGAEFQVYVEHLQTNPNLLDLAK